MRIEEIFSTFAGSHNHTIPVSFEMFPPKGDLVLEHAREVVAEVAPLCPSFVSVTYSAGGSGNAAKTIDIAHMIQTEFNTTSMAHLTCAGQTIENVDHTLDEIKAAGIDNVLALRGDAFNPNHPGDFSFAKDLIPLAAEHNLCVGAAAYPEGHIQCEDFNESLQHLKQKQDAGASFFVTQLFFDNEFAFRFLDAARNCGITIPITFGVMPFLSKDQISRMVFMCGASLPAPIIKLLNRYADDPTSLKAAGIEFACNQLEGLAQAGVDGVHVYTMNQPCIACAAVTALQNAGFKIGA